MKTLLVVVVLLVAGVVGLGFYRGWFSFTSDSSDAKSNVTLTVDQDKFREDREAATESVQDLGRQAKNKVAGPGEKVTDGTMVSLQGGELTITDKEGKEHRHTLAADVTVICDTQKCKAADLKPGMKVRVTTAKAEPHAVTKIEAFNNDRAFE
ncbi:MAG: hypothetical protein ACK4RK_18660 [Gemmataceae bacterium]